MSAYYTCRYRLSNGEWQAVVAWNDTPLCYLTLEQASASIERIVSLDGVIEGTVHDDQDAVVERWCAGLYRSPARKMETVCSPAPGKPETGAPVG